MVVIFTKPYKQILNSHFLNFLDDLSSLASLAAVLYVKEQVRASHILNESEVYNQVILEIW